jgi:NAD(P)-dependent dehydrogenase (short-subunit alcohol dehydrogenase family)
MRWKQRARRVVAVVTKRGSKMDFKGKRIVILGGSSGIGLGTAQAAAKAGASVIIVSSRRERVDQALKSLPAGVEGHVVDLVDETAVRDFFGMIDSFDHLVFTAGESLELGPIAQTGIEQAQRFFRLRYWGAFMAAKYGNPKIKTGGSIVFTSGLAGTRPHAGWSLGASICSAMEGLTRALAVELAPIRVNIVCPGVVKSPLWANMAETDRDALYRGLADKLLVGHVGETDEIAKAYLYLIGQTYSTGQVVVVDGGGALV